MCGITGMYALHGALDPELRAALPRMNDAIVHRGPDAGAEYHHERVALGHRRLSIIDREGGAQPMANADGTAWIVFNGEIYNHGELRKELFAHGHVLRTRCDTEVLLHAVEQWGAGALERLDGMFAFATFDTRTGELLLARDRLGKKPLFWTVLGDTLHFASEMKALRQSPRWKGDIAWEALEGYLALGYLLAPGTIHREVHKLEPGCYLRARDGAIETRRYWDVTRFDDNRSDAPAAAERLDHLLRHAVQSRLESEVPLGAFLSGGIDSGLVVSYMAETLGDRLHAVTVGFGDAAHDEVAAASTTARHFGARQHVEQVEPRFDETLDAIVGAFDEPFADSSAIPTYWVCKLARKHLTVVLSGDGGDESFGGYDFRYIPHVLEDRVRRLLPGPARTLARVAGARWPRSQKLPRALRAGTFLENLGYDAEAAYFSDLCFLKPAAVRALLGLAPNRDPRASAVYEAVVAPYRRCPSPHPQQRAQYADLMVYLPNDVLVKVDRMSMLHSIEVRCPLLDHHVVEAAFRVPAPVKSPLREPKRLLRTLARTRLPPSLLTLKKHGFTAPVGRWLREDYRERFRDEVLGPGAHVRAHLDVAQLARWFEQHERGAADHWYVLWAAWVLERWLRLMAHPR